MLLNLGQLLPYSYALLRVFLHGETPHSLANLQALVISFEMDSTLLRGIILFEFIIQMQRAATCNNRTMVGGLSTPALN